MCVSDSEKQIQTSYKVDSKSKSRTCTDCICLLIFFLFIAGMVVITALIVLDGSFDKLIKGTDSYGNLCDTANPKRNLNVSQKFNGQDTRGLKYVFYFNYTDLLGTTKVCVRSCPNVYLNTTLQLAEYLKTPNGSICEYDVEAGRYVYDGRCPPLPVFKTTPIGNRCVPNIGDLLDYQIRTHSAQVAEFINSKKIQTYIIRTYEKLDKVGYLSLIAFGIGLVLIFLLRFFAKIMVIILLMISAILCVAASVFLLLKYLEYKRNPPIMTTIPLIGKEIDAETAYLIYTIVSCVVTAIYLLIILFLAKRIGLVLQLFAEAQKVLVNMIFLLVMPVFTFIILFLFLGYWVVTAFMIYSFGQFKAYDYFIYGYQIDRGTLSTIFWCYHIVGLIWISEFIFACQSMVVASSAAQWYFSFDKSSLGMPILKSIWRLTVYHLGSMAFGSFIITLLRIPRLLISFFRDKIEASQSSTAKGCADGCSCFLRCLEKFIKYVNYNAYTIIAIEGKSYCVSAERAFKIILDNALRVAAINSVGDFILFISKLIVTFLTLIIALFLIKDPNDQILDVNNTLRIIEYDSLTFILVAIIAFLIAHCFFTIYEMIIDSLMVCFSVDCQVNNGSGERPYYMSRSLKKFVSQSDTAYILKN